MIDQLLSKNIVPEFAIRTGIRKLLKDRLKEITPSSSGFDPEIEFIKIMDSSPVAIKTQEANEQHYEVPSKFYEYVLGKNLKYSCAYFDANESLSVAEEKMLELTCKRAELKDGQKILELGCGWGSLTLFMAKKYPNAEITAVSNSNTQRKFIMEQAKTRNLKNLNVITCDANDFQTDLKFDRCVSVEMFEHMRNYRSLLKRVSSFLNENGKLFIHIFVHNKYPYTFDVKDESDWMSKYFFSGGIMPSNNLLYHFEDIFKVEEHWQVNGEHYAKTSEAWLKNMKEKKSEILTLFKEHYPKGEHIKWYSYWKIFFMACAELWKFRDGKEWYVSHYLLTKNS